jgi:hypothetical protein
MILKIGCLRHFFSMVMEAVLALREKGGSSRQSVLNFLTKKFDFRSDDKSIKDKISAALRFVN